MRGLVLLASPRLTGLTNQKNQFPCHGVGTIDGFYKPRLNTVCFCFISLILAFQEQ